MWKCLQHSVHHAAPKVTRSYVHPIPTENNRSRSHPRIGIAVVIIPCVISISKSMPLLNFAHGWMSNLELQNWCQHVVAFPYLALHVPEIFFVLIFRPRINHNKNCHETFYIQFSQTDVCWAYKLVTGRKTWRAKTLKGQNTEGSNTKKKPTVSRRKKHFAKTNTYLSVAVWMCN